MKNLAVRIQRRNRNERLGFLIAMIFIMAGAIKFLGHEVTSIKAGIKVTPVKESPHVPKETDVDHIKKLENYKSELAMLLKSLPTKERLQALSEDQVHSSPEIVLQAALSMAKVTDEMSRDEELRPLALEFYTQCVNMPDGIPAVQAVCLKHVRSLSQELGSSELDVAVNAEVEKLAW